MVDKTKTVVFLNKATGKQWAVNPGSPAHDRVLAGMARGEYEAVQPETPTRSRGRSPKTDG